jgi:hypothetical protein
MGPPKPAQFLPSRHGFGFANEWPDEPALCLPTPIGRVGVGNAARGLCGGMVFGALDYWHAAAEPPASLPLPSDRLFRFIVWRLIQSWHIPIGVARYYYWMNLPDADVIRRPASLTRKLRRGVRTRSTGRQWPRIRTRLDAGEPVPLGLVTVAGANPLRLGRNHQVLAYAYRVAGTQVTLQVYDPNSGPADDVYIQFDVGAPNSAWAHSVNIGLPVRGFFATKYSPVTPPGSARPRS